MGIKSNYLLFKEDVDIRKWVLIKLVKMLN